MNPLKKRVVLIITEGVYKSEVNDSFFVKPSIFYQNYAHFNIDHCTFSGKRSYEGYCGGVPMMYNGEERSLAVDAMDNHTLVYGSSGSKKTRCLVMPTIKIIGHAGESMIIHDSKGELYDRTAEMLHKLGYNVVIINYRDPTVGNCWNPLYIPYMYYKNNNMDKAAEFANDIATSLILGETANTDPFWDYASCDCFFGLLLLLFRFCKENGEADSSVNISNLIRLRRVLYEKGDYSKTTNLWKWASQDELIAASLSGTVFAPRDTRNSILAVLDQKLRSFIIRPSLLDMLANNNVDIEEIGKQKTVVFLITPDEKTTYHRLVSLFISQSYQYLIYSALNNENRKLNIRINYILDEFSSLPVIGSDFPSMIVAARSRNIRFLIVAQSKNQLIKRYKEEAETIVSNCTNWIFITSRELGLLQEISQLCGKNIDNKPNISVYDLQHFSKESNEALVLAGRKKPCIVNLIDIDQIGDRNYSILGMITPERLPRTHINFLEIPKSVKDHAIIENTESMRTSLEKDMIDIEVMIASTNLVNAMLKQMKQEKKEEMHNNRETECKGSSDLDKNDE